VILLDNMSAEEMAAMVPRLREAAAKSDRKVELEASGGMTLDDVDSVAATGVDRISVGALTHSAPVLDLSFLVEVES
jgi:nicotinate-nucleotide pyrophosphorylase (carboxylating)